MDGLSVREISGLATLPPQLQEVVNRRAFYKKEAVCLALRHPLPTHTCPPTSRIQ